MAHNVYAVYDLEEMKLFQFATLDDVLAKDAVLAFIEENALALFGSGGLEVKQDCQTDISATDSVESLIEVLFSRWAMVLNLIQVK